MKIQKDKILHFAVCAIVGFVIAGIIAMLSRDFLCAFVAGVYSGVVMGIGKEYGDSKAVGNKWDWYDMLADTIGAFAGSAVGGLLAFAI